MLKTHATAYLFLLPNLVAFTVFLLVPIGWLIRQSFMTGGVLGPASWVGLDNWDQALSDRGVRDALWVTVKYTALVEPPLFILAIIIAVALREVAGKRASVIRALVYFPALAPFVLASLIWTFMVHPDFGLLNIGNRAVGTEPINWLGDSALALPSLAMLEVWRGVGFWALFLLAALLGVPNDLYDAAAVDGARRWRRFWHVTLPWLRPTLVVALLLSTISAMQAFDSAFILTDGGPAGATTTAVLYIYRSVFQSANPGYGAVISFLLLVAILVITMVVLRVLRERK